MTPTTQQMPSTAMVLAAGLGKRMRSYSSHVPKPMVEIAGVSLINRVLNQLSAAGVNNVVVNLHHKADMLAEHLSKRTSSPKITISHETELLETGGGVRHALNLLGDKPFFVINSDALWSDGNENTLHHMANQWTSNMQAMLLLLNTNKLDSYSGNGDFYMSETGALSRPNDNKTKPFLFTGVQILNPDLIKQFDEGVFSLNKVYDLAIDQNGLYGVSHKGAWHHVGSGQEVTIAEQFYK